MGLTEHNEVSKVLNSVEREEGSHLSAFEAGVLQTGDIKEGSCLVGHLLNTYLTQGATQGGKPKGGGRLVRDGETEMIAGIPGGLKSRQKQYGLSKQKCCELTHTYM